jgi:hypothetical protein
MISRNSSKKHRWSPYAAMKLPTAVHPKNFLQGKKKSINKNIHKYYKFDILNIVILDPLLISVFAST